MELFRHRHFLIALFPFLATFPTDVTGPVLFCLHKGDPKKAFENYLSYAQEIQTHDFALLQQAAKALLEKGIDSKDPEIHLMCVFGAGISASSDLLPILEKGVHSDDLRTQLVALSYLGRQQDDEADMILLGALSSPFLITRLEALLQLAKKNHPDVLGHLYSLSVKIPDLARTALGQIAVELEGLDASRYLHKLLTDASVNVRIETISAVANAHRDDFIPCLHNLASGPSFAQQEAVASAFGELKDLSSIDLLKELAESKYESVKLASQMSLYKLGNNRYLQQIEESAKRGSHLAITVLGTIQEGAETLYQLLSHNDRDIRLNAILALLNHRDRKALDFLEEILVEDCKDIGFWQLSSPGGSLKTWKTIPSSSIQTKNYPGIKGQTTNLREKILTQCVEFEEQDFLKIADLILTKKQNSLIPLLIDLLENKKSPGIIEFLKQGLQKTGAPLIRNYCMLALYRLKVEGPYEEQLISWIKTWGGENLIRFREETEPSKLIGSHQLTPEETSQFLVEACQTLASALNTTGLEILIHAIAYGNPKNRYALAGLLLRATE